MNYATLQDLIGRFGERELIELTDPDLLTIQAERVQRALDDAQVFADGFLGRVYRLPLTGCAFPAPLPGDPGAVQWVVPPQLRRIVCDVARYYLYHDVAPEHEVYLRYKAAERELQAVAEGKMVLACPAGGLPGVPLTGLPSGEADVAWAFSPRQMTDDSLRGFA